MMVFGMTRPRGELTTYRARGGHATDCRTVGREFASRPGHTKDHHKNVNNIYVYKDVCMCIHACICTCIDIRIDVRV